MGEPRRVIYSSWQGGCDEVVDGYNLVKLGLVFVAVSGSPFSGRSAVDLPLHSAKTELLLLLLSFGLLVVLTIVSDSGLLSRIQS